MDDITVGIKQAWSYLGVEPEKLRPLLVAEASNNHDGNLETAKKMIEAAYEAGMDAIKFQTFTGAELYVEEMLDSELDIGVFKGRRRELIEHNEFSPDEWREIAAYADKVGIPFISTPLGFGSADLLESIGVPLYKVASMDVNNPRFLTHLARKGKPIILSTGMSMVGEIDAAVATIQAAGNDKIILLHCISQYPVPVEKANLRMMTTLRDTFGLPVGYSDHTIGPDAAMAATAIGACVIEKHMTLDKNAPGPEHHMCADSDDLRELANRIASVSQALGSPLVRVLDAEQGTRRFARRSLVSAQAIAKNTIITADMITVKRPGWGIPADSFDLLVGAKALADIPADSLIRWSDVVLSDERDG